MKSACPRCGGNHIELHVTQTDEPSHAVLFVQCSSCGMAVSTAEDYYPARLITHFLRRIMHRLKRTLRSQMRPGR